MRKTFILLTVLLSLFVSTNAVAQFEQQKAMFIFRTDGSMNGMLYESIDSITYSNIGIDNLEHPSIVVQEVWTPDSVYRIPLEEIDSVTFISPKPEFADDVFHITESHLPYIIKIDSLDIYFRYDTPRDMLPSFGQVIISDTRKHPLEDGFAGRVQTVVDADTAKVFACGSNFKITDIFKRLALVIEARMDSTQQSNSKMRKAPQLGVKNTSGGCKLYWDNTDGLSMKLENKKTEKNFNVTASYLPNIDFTKFEFNINEFWEKDNGSTSYINVEGHITHKVKINSEIALEGEEEFESASIEAGIPIYDIINFKIGGCLFMKYNGSVSASGDVEFNTKTRFGGKWDNEGWTWTRDFDCEIDPNVKLSLKGSLTTGLRIYTNINTISSKVLGIQGDFDIGVKYDGKTFVDWDNVYESSSESTLYPIIKDFEADISPALDFNLKSTVFFKDYKLYGKDLAGFLPDYKLKAYLVPEFSSVNLAGGSDQAIFTANASRITMMPVTIGMGIYDSSGNCVIKMWNESTYDANLQKDYNMPYTLKSDALTEGAVYKAYPMIKFMGKDLKCTPAVETEYHQFRALNTNPKIVVGASDVITVIGGSGTSKVLEYNPAIATVVSQSATSVDGTSAIAYKVLGVSEGYTTMTIVDEVTQEKIFANVTVSSDGSTITEEFPTSISIVEGMEVTLTLPKGNWAVRSYSNRFDYVRGVKKSPNIIMKATDSGGAHFTVMNTDTYETHYVEVYIYPNDKEVIRLATSGSHLRLNFAKHNTSHSAWVDLNYNGLKDEGEDDFTYDPSARYIFDKDVESQRIAIYGPVYYLFECANTGLTRLDFSDFGGSIEKINCNDNAITSLDLSGVSVKALNCSNNEIETLKLPTDQSLTELKAQGNKLSSIDLSNFANLYDLDISNNSLTDITLPTNGALQYLYLYDNPSVGTLDISGCSNLIYVHLWNCGLSSLTLPTTAEELEDLIVYDNQLTTLALPKSADKLDNLNVYNNKLSDIELPSAPNMEWLDLGCNDFAELNIPAYTKLEMLCVQYNSSLSSIDISHLTSLRTFLAQRCQLSSIDVSKNTKLETLLLDGNNLSSLDLTKNQNLRCFGAQNNLFWSSELNKIYEQLPDISKETDGSGLWFPDRFKMLRINYNRGYSSSDTSIATNKGWILTTSTEAKSKKVSPKETKRYMDK